METAIRHFTDTKKMPHSLAEFKPTRIKQNVIVIVGGLGSGKSEVAVNLAYHLVQSQPLKVRIGDLDIHNPYFRSREAFAQLTEMGIESLVPPGAQIHADLPIIIPEIKGAIKQAHDKLILDVGGDDTGARVLSSLAEAFVAGNYDLLLVLNANRPFTADLTQSLKMIREIEASSRLKFTGIISNTHLMDATTPETVMQGVALSEEVSQSTGVPIVCVAATKNIARALDPSGLKHPLLILNRSLLKPWEKRTK